MSTKRARRPRSQRKPTLEDLARRVGVSLDQARGYLTATDTENLAGWVRNEIEDYRERGGITPPPPPLRLRHA